MAITPQLWPHALSLGAALLFTTAIAIVALVIPPVAADTFPGATPERAVLAFWGIATVDTCAAALLMLLSRRPLARGWVVSSLVGLLAVLLLLQAIALTDAATAYVGHGAAMHPVTLILACCVMASLLTIGLVVADLVRRRRR